MTSQILDTLQVGNLKLGMRGSPLCSAKLLGLRLPLPAFHCTALWRGHVASWRLQEGRLVLVKVKNAAGFSIPMSGPLASSTPIWAHWYSGESCFPDAFDWTGMPSRSGWALLWSKGELQSVWKVDGAHRSPSDLEALCAHFEAQPQWHGTPHREEKDPARRQLARLALAAAAVVVLIALSPLLALGWLGVAMWRSVRASVRGQGRRRRIRMGLVPPVAGTMLVADEGAAACTKPRLCLATEQPILEALDGKAGGWSQVTWRYCSMQEASERLAPGPTARAADRGGLLAPQWFDLRLLHREGDRWVAFEVPHPESEHRPATLHGLAIAREGAWVARWVHGITWAEQALPHDLPDILDD